MDMVRVLLLFYVTKILPLIAFRLIIKELTSSFVHTMSYSTG